ncbi:acyl-CoA dehydrogenase family protein [Nonomuraea sp. NPDC050328]|uniref:acyl-CoA dehydrogenase family protein n=1 Tax=Nonomuraea sp. NPDC050328 TaxID=3364361 RepID=UPI00378D500F
MDFSLDETQSDLRKLAREILAAETDAWPALREAGLTEICAPEPAGSALGAVELAVVLREVGARAAPLPMLPHLAGTLALAGYGRTVDGLVTVATRGTDGRASSVPYAAQADHLVVATDQEVLLVGEWTSVPEFTSTGEPAATVAYASGERLGDDAERVRDLVLVAAAAQASGVLAGALELTTEHIRTRRQFGRALAEFQAVTMQIADVYVASRALDVALWAAAWGGDPRDAALAAFHVSEAFRALYTCQHLHGGLGLDVTYPLHRYFAQAKQLTHLTGGADAQLDRMGALA